MSPEIKVEQVESGDVSCFVVSYTLITEEHPIIIKCGEQDFIEQFLLVWSFTIMRFGQPYFTYSGLNRMIRDIIISFTKNNFSSDHEVIEWTSETSSTIVAEMAAQLLTQFKICITSKLFS